MSEQHPISSLDAVRESPAFSTPARRRAATKWHRVGANLLVGGGILLALGSLWWLAFWLTARMATDVQFTGVSLPEYQWAISLVLITGIVGLLVPALLVIALGVYLRQRWP